MKHQKKIKLSLVLFFLYSIQIINSYNTPKQNLYKSHLESFNLSRKSDLFMRRCIASISISIKAQEIPTSTPIPPNTKSELRLENNPTSLRERLDSNEEAKEIKIKEESESKDESKEEKKYKEIIKETKNTNPNKILLTELQILEKKLNKEEISRYFSESSNLSIDLNGGLSPVYRRSQELDILTGKRAIDESLQVGSIGEDLNLNRNRENLLEAVRIGMERYKNLKCEFAENTECEAGDYPKDLSVFSNLNEHWARVWWEGRMRNISELGEILEYKPFIKKEERNKRIYEFWKILTEKEKNNPDFHVKTMTPMNREERNNLPDALGNPDLGYQSLSARLHKRCQSFKSKKSCLDSIKKDNTGFEDALTQKVYYQFFRGDQIREAANLLIALDKLAELDTKKLKFTEEIPSFSLEFKEKNPEKINISELNALEIESHDYEEMIKKEGLKFEVPKISRLVPKDYFFVHFDDIEKFLEFKKSIEKTKEKFSFLDNLNFSDFTRTEKLILKRLGIPEDENIYDLISEFAFISEDLAFTKRTDFAVLVKFKNNSSKILAKMIETGENHFSSLDDFFVFATERQVFEKIKNASENENSLAQEKDFHYSLGVLDSRKNGLIYFSDAFIRKLTSPAYRLNARRKNTILTALESLQYLVWAYKDITGAWPKDLEEIESAGYIEEGKIFEAKKYQIDTEGIVRHEDWGSVFTPAPVNRVEIKEITSREKNLYEDFREMYHDFYQEFFDPVGIGIIVADKISLHTIILPLIENSDYNFIRALFGSISEKELDFIKNPGREVAILAAATFSLDDFLLSTSRFLFGLGYPYSYKEITKYLDQYFKDKGCYPQYLEEIARIAPDIEIINFENAFEMSGYEGLNFYHTWNDDSCFRLAFADERSGKVAANKDGGFNDDLYELFSSEECRQDAKEDIFHISEKDMERIEKEIKNKKLKAIKEDIAKELGLEPEEGRVFDFLGDEIMFGIGKGNKFDSENYYDFSNLDMYIAIKLKDSKKAQEILKKFFKKISENSDSRGGFGFFNFSQIKPIRNEYKGREYFMLPTGFLNVFYLFFNDRFYLGLSQLAINRIIDQAGTKESNLPKNLKRILDFTGTEKNIVFLANTESLKNWIDGKSIKKSLEYNLESLLAKQKFYLSEAFSLAEIQPDFDGSLKNVERFYKNIPTGFFGFPIKIKNGKFSLETGEESFYLDKIKTGSANVMRYNLSHEEETKDEEVGEEQEIDFSKILEKINLDSSFDIFDILSNFGIGFSFTNHGVDIRLAIDNPMNLNEKIDEKFSVKTVNQEISKGVGKKGKDYSFISIALVVSFVFSLGLFYFLFRKI